VKRPPYAKSSDAFSHFAFDKSIHVDVLKKQRRTENIGLFLVAFPL
jgi:hypothetical protein